MTVNVQGVNRGRVQEDKADKWELVHAAAHMSKAHIVLIQEAWGSEGRVERRTWDGWCCVRSAVRRMGGTMEVWGARGVVMHMATGYVLLVLVNMNAGVGAVVKVHLAPKGQRNLLSTKITTTARGSRSIRFKMGGVGWGLE